MTGRNYVTVRDSTTLAKPTTEKIGLKKGIAYQRAAPFTPLELAAEVWRPIPGHESRWHISSLGRVRNASEFSKHNKPTKPCLATQLGRDGYERLITSFIDDTGKRWTVQFRIHRMVAMAFLPNTESLPIVHHKDNDKLNNRLPNLEWVTARENVAHGIAQIPGRYKAIKNLHKFSSRANTNLRSKS